MYEDEGFGFLINFLAILSPVLLFLYVGVKIVLVQLGVITLPTPEVHTFAADPICSFNYEYDEERRSLVPSFGLGYAEGLIPAFGLSATSRTETVGTYCIVCKVPSGDGQYYLLEFDSKYYKEYLICTNSPFEFRSEDEQYYVGEVPITAGKLSNEQATAYMKACGITVEE